MTILNLNFKIVKYLLAGNGTYFLALSVGRKFSMTRSSPSGEIEAPADFVLIIGRFDEPD